MTREGDEQPPETVIRRTVRYYRTPPTPDPSDPEAVAARLRHAMAEKLISEGRCPVHPYRRLTREAPGLSARGGGTCEDCPAFWSYSPRTGIVFIGPSPALPDYPPGPPIPARPIDTLGVNGFSIYLAAEKIGQLIEMAEILDNTPFAAEDAVEAGKNILYAVEAGNKILIIAAGMVLGRKLGYSR